MLWHLLIKNLDFLIYVSTRSYKQISFYNKPFALDVLFVFIVLLACGGGGGVVVVLVVEVVLVVVGSET